MKKLKPDAYVVSTLITTSTDALCAARAAVDVELDVLINGLALAPAEPPPTYADVLHELANALRALNDHYGFPRES